MQRQNVAILVLSVLFFSSIFYIFLKEKASIKNIYSQVIADYKNKDDFSQIKFYKPLANGIVGEYDENKNFRRLNKTDKKNVRNVIWNLSQNSSGVQIHFETNSSKIAVKFQLSEFSNGGNINNIAKNGVDLYVNNNYHWQFVNSGIPLGKINQVMLIKNMVNSDKKFILNLPLYNSIEKIEIGIEKNSKINFYNHFKGKMVVYGTSITQGASASRPGLAYTNIISRKLNKEVVNLGFSGNAFFEKKLALILCKNNPDFFIIDATPNSSPLIIKNNTKAFLQTIISCKPKTPIIVLESIIRENSKLNFGNENTFGSLKYIKKQNIELEKIVNSLKANNLYYIKADSLIGNDTEATVDGTHLNDLGMVRISKQIINKIKQIKQSKL